MEEQSLRKIDDLRIFPETSTENVEQMAKFGETLCGHSDRGIFQSMKILQFLYRNTKIFGRRWGYTRGTPKVLRVV